MTMGRATLVLASLCAVLAITTPASGQMGGGGGGMADGPSSRRDPAEFYNAGVEAMEASDYAEAVRQFSRARRGAPNDANINYALGVAQVGAGESADAKTSFERAIRADTPPAGAWLQLGLVAIELGDRDTAVAQEAALQQRVEACDASCGATRRAQLQNAHDQLARALAAPAP